MKKTFHAIFSAAAFVMTGVVAVCAPAAMSGRASSIFSSPGTEEADGLREAKAKPAVRSRYLSSEAKPATESIEKAATDMPQICGSVLSSSNWRDADAIGLYKIPTSSDMGFEMIAEGPNARNGGVAVDGVYWTNVYKNYGTHQEYKIIGYDLSSGNEIANYDVNQEYIAVGGLTYDATTGKVYAITNAATGTGYQFVTIDYGMTSATLNRIATISQMFNTIAAAPDGTIYGITCEQRNYTTVSSTLVKFDKQEGSYVEIGKTGKLPEYASSAVIDPQSGRMFWTLSPADDKGYLCEVDLTTGEASTIYRFPGNEQVCGIYIPTAPAADTAPAAVSNLAANFENGALEGTVSFTAPATLFDGTPAEGELDYTVLVNGETSATGKTAFGADVETPVTLPGSGTYTIQAFVSNAAGDSPKESVKIIAGTGVPAKPSPTAQYADGKINVRWPAVTESVDGGYIDPAEVTYTVVRYPGNTVLARDIKENGFEDNIGVPTGYISYTYGVTAKYADLSSEEGMSNTITMGIATPPYSQDFNGSDPLAGFTIINSNNDSGTWQAYEGAVRVMYNSAAQMDDWLITPPLKLENNKTYKLTFKTYGQTDKYTERLEVKCGTENTVAGMTTELLAPTDITWGPDKARTLTAYIDPSKTGTYYIGFHGISEKNQFFLYIDDISVEAGISDFAPAAPSNLTVTPDASGALKARISFKTPTEQMNGSELYTLPGVRLLRNGVEIKSWSYPDVGEFLSYEDNVTEAGEYEYSVIAKSYLGEGKPATATVYIGVDYPGNVENLEIGSQPGSGEVTLTWPAVTKSISGAAMPEANISYNVYKVQGSSEVLVAEKVKGTTYSFNAVPEGQQFVQCEVRAVTDRGEGGGRYSAMIPVGVPYAGIRESFPGAVPSYIWGDEPIANDAGSVGQIDFLDDNSGIPSQDNDGGCIGVYAPKIGSGAGLYSGLVSLEGISNPSLSFYTFDIASINGADARPDINEVRVAVKPFGEQEYTQVYEGVVENICNGYADGWGLVAVDLTPYEGKVIQFMISGIDRRYTTIPIDNIRIASGIRNDLALAGIEAPAEVTAGSDYTVEVTVVNMGVAAAEGYTVELYANNSKVDEMRGETLNSEERTTLSFNRSFSAIAFEPVTYKAVLVYEPDEVLTNNETSEIAVSPKFSDLPAVTDLAGSKTEEGVLLTWSEPEIPDNLTIEGYDIYRNGEKINDEPVEECEYLDTDKEPNIYTYVVVAKYAEGVSAPSNEVDINTTGIGAIATDEVSIKVKDNRITVACASDTDVIVVNAAGETLYSGRGNAAIEVAGGVYLVRAGGLVKKILVK